jgi:FdrA protein
VSVLKTQVRPGGYYDSIVLMQLQAALADLPGVLDAGAVMATPDNRALLAAGELLPGGEILAGPPDLLIVVKADSESAADEALARVDALLVRSGGPGGADYRPQSLEAALKALPEARWALVSVPGRFAARVAGEALDHGLNVFLYSDNVSLADEVGLKTRAVAEGRLVMGPDCGTASINGTGFGFANRVRRGPIGLVGASGTGLQAITSHVHALGGGVSHAIGTGGRDLDAEVGALTCRQGLDLLARDPGTEVIVLVSKPPVPSVARSVLRAARGTGKPVVVHFVGFAAPGRKLGNLYFAEGLSEAAWIAVELSKSDAAVAGAGTPLPAPGEGRNAPGFLRGLFAGGTLASESLQALANFLEPLHSNIKSDGVLPLATVAHSEAHTILDLGADEYTVGRLHPMIDNDMRLRRLAQEAADPEVGLILLDVVLGDGAHPDPAGELAPAIAAARGSREVEFVAVVVGTDEDPQGLESQVEALTESGARVFEDLASALGHVVGRLGGWASPPVPPVDAGFLTAPVAAVNIGLESFSMSLLDQGAEAVHVEWRPPAGGDARLLSILDKLRR